MYPLEHYRNRNTFSISLVEFFWGLGMPVLIESTFLQLFLRHYQASFFIIGLLPLFFNIGIPIMSLGSAYLTSTIERKRGLVIIVHVLAAIPIFTFGLIFYFFPIGNYAIPLFLFIYAVFSCGIGLTLPVWQNYLVKIFTERDTLRALSIMNITQSLTKLACSFILFKIIDTLSITKGSAGLVFLSTGIVLIIGSFFFAISVESTDSVKQNKTKFLSFNQFFKLFGQSLGNHNFVLFLFNEAGYFAIVNIISFYAAYAEEICRIDPAVVSGLFITAGFSGGIIIQFVIGYLNLFSLKNKYIIEKLLSLLGIICLICLTATWSFLLASFLLGAGRAIRLLCYPLAIKKIFKAHDATPYFAFTPLFILPVSAGLPMLTGKLLDLFTHYGRMSYQILFLVMGIIVLISLTMVTNINFGEPNNINKENERL
ncbi:MAG: MFS transporter [Spirochaetes bacterium]|nr:MFS transporter [Spirochaetota bacterium]